MAAPEIVAEWTAGGKRTNQVEACLGDVLEGLWKVSKENRKEMDLREMEDSDGSSESDAPSSPQGCTSAGYEDKITLVQLKALQRVFITDDGRERCLSEHEFVHGFSNVLGSMLSKRKLRKWFSYIDARGTQRVDWNGFSTYILLEAQQRVLKDSVQSEYVGQSNPTAKDVDVHHSDIITLILVHPRNGRYALWVMGSFCLDLTSLLCIEDLRLFFVEQDAFSVMFFFVRF